MSTRNDRLDEASRVDTITPSQLRRERVWTCADPELTATGVVCLGCGKRWSSMTEHERHMRAVGITAYRGPGPLRGGGGDS